MGSQPTGPVDQQANKYKWAFCIWKTYSLLIFISQDIICVSYFKKKFWDKKISNFDTIIITNFLKAFSHETFLTRDLD